MCERVKERDLDLQLRHLLVLLLHRLGQDFVHLVHARRAIASSNPRHIKTLVVLRLQRLRLLSRQQDQTTNLAYLCKQHVSSPHLQRFELRVDRVLLRLQAGEFLVEFALLLFCLVVCLRQHWTHAKVCEQ